VRKGWLLWLAVGIAAAPSAASAAVPTTQTCSPANLPLTYVLPADWSCEGAPPNGNVASDAKAGGMAPGFVVQLNIYAARFSGGGTVTRDASRLVATVRQEFAQIPGVRISHTSTTVGAASYPAVLVGVSYRGLSFQGVEAMTHLDYFFVARGDIYELDFTGATKWIAKEMSAIKACARSIRFPLKA
jgi:hypothetical protein